MSKTIKKIKAKKKLFELFPPSVDPISLYNKYSDDMFLDMLRQLQVLMPFKNSWQNVSLSHFLYAGCLHFDRWFSPSPYIVNLESYKNFDMFLDTLLKIEKHDSQNTAIFQVHQLKNDFYLQFDECPIEKVEKLKLDDFDKKLSLIKCPSHPLKQREFIAAQNELSSLIKAAREKSLRTIFKTSIPFILNCSKLKLSFNWRNIRVKMSSKPNFNQSLETFVGVYPASVTYGASRWQIGTTDIELEFASIIDADIYTKCLQAINDIDFKIKGWPKCFSVVFSVIDEIVWKLRIEQDYKPSLILAPRDIADVESFLLNKDEKIDFKIKGSPANIMKAFKPSDEILEIDFKDLSPLPWSIKCKSLATMYLELGETNDSLFWLNVATESLFKERFEIISIQINNPELEAELNSPKAFWDPAEKIVTSQFPNMAGKVKWPDNEIHVSIYAKLKYLYKKIQMKTDVKYLLENYRKISKYRNALFHGALDVRMPVDKVEIAIRSFDWIFDNMVLNQIRESDLES